jgi:hypothetical protein
VIAESPGKEDSSFYDINMTNSKTMSAEQSYPI